MSGVPKVAYDVHGIRKAGWPTGGDAHGHGVPTVVDGVTPIQGDGNAAHRAKWDRSITTRCR
jgi:hypothetical protein